MACCKGLSNMGLVVAPEELALAYWQYFSLPHLFGAHEGLMESPKVQLIQQLAAKGRDVYFREFMDAANAGVIFVGAFDLPPPEGPETPDSVKKPI